MIIDKGKYSYQVIDLDLTAGLDDFQIDIEGAQITYQAGVSDILVKLDSNSNHQITLSPKDRLRADFTKVFISANAYAETISIVISKPDFHIDKKQFQLSGTVDIDQVADLRDDSVKRTALTELTGASFSYQSGSGTTTVVSAVANANGIIIRVAGVNCVSAASFWQLSTVANTNVLLGAGSNGQGNSAVIKDIFVPAGLPFVYYANHANSWAYAVYEVL